VVCCVLYGLINLWALWALPLIVDDYMRTIPVERDTI
jgi:hypothetical protein